MLNKGQRNGYIMMIVFLLVLLVLANWPIPNQLAPPIVSTPWIKQDILIEMEIGRGITIWTDNAKEDKIKVDKIPGITATWITDNGHSIYALIDPRYKKTMVVEKIFHLLTLGGIDIPVASSDI